MVTLKFYDCLLTLGGDPVLMQIKKQNISERELRVLRHVHGDGSITEVRPTEVDGKPHEQPVDETAHYYELAQKFDNDVELIERIFNKTLDGFESWIFERQYQEEQQRADKDRTRRAAASQADMVAPASAASSVQSIE